MVRKKTHEQFIKEFYEKNSNADNIEILERYKGVFEKIECKCRVCNHTWTPTPQILLGGSNCPKCAKKNSRDSLKKTHEQFIKEFYEKNSNADNIEILEEYTNARTKIKCRCKIDGYEWTPRPNDLLSDSGCPMCSGRPRKTTEYFIKELKEKNPNADNIKISEEYINDDTKIKCECKICNHIWKTKPRVLLNGSGCPKCNNSKGEKAIAKYLEEHNIDFKEQYRFNDCRFYRPLPFDFYIPSLNMVIEFDGEYHYKFAKYKNSFDRFVDRKIRDTIKTIYCRDNNIKLIRIPYWELYNGNLEKILDEILN